MSNRALIAGVGLWVVAAIVGVAMSGCGYLYIRAPGDDTSKYPLGVKRFDEGNVTCYIYWEHTISCVRH